MPKKNKISSTQDYLPIAKIEQDALVLKDTSLRVVLKAEPINFDLKSELEQNAIIYGYQSFLNSLQFPIQIIIRSKRLDLERYLIKLESQTNNIKNNLLQIQARDYISFVRRLIQIANIMSKQFYVVVGYQNVSTTSQSLLNHLPNRRGKIVLNQSQFQAMREELINRANIIMSGLDGIGIKSQILNTQQLIELFYNIYNPEESTSERLAPIEELDADIISAGQKEDKTHI